jgi:hypothetical protein
VKSSAATAVRTSNHQDTETPKKNLTAEGAETAEKSVGRHIMPAQAGIQFFGASFRYLPAPGSVVGAIAAEFPDLIYVRFDFSVLPALNLSCRAVKILLKPAE